MKLNVSQSIAVIKILVYEYGPTILDEYLSIARLFSKKSSEIRIIHRYGMAGKLWNNNGRIYISGHNKDEIGETEYLKEQVEIQQVNREIADAIKSFEKYD